MEKIAEKIRRLIAHADSTTHPEEASTFLAKAQALMEEHSISLLDLGRLDSDDPVAVEKNVYRGHTIDGWRQLLATQLAIYFGCRMIQTKDGGNRWHSIAGRLSARTTYLLMWPYVDRQVMQQAREAVSKREFRSINIARRQIGHALAARVYRMAKENESASVARRGLAGINALVPVDTIEAAIKEALGSIEEMGRGSVSYEEKARDRANSISLNLQTTGRSAPAKRITAQ